MIGIVLIATTVIGDVSWGYVIPEPASMLDVHRPCGEPVEDGAYYDSLIRALGDTSPEIETAIEYMETEWRVLPPRQLAGVTIKQILEDFTAHPIAEMVSGRSTISIADIIDQGRLLYIHLPLAGRERMARILTTLIRLEFQREILRRPKKARPSFLLADEFQSFLCVGRGAWRFRLFRAIA